MAMPRMQQNSASSSGSLEILGALLKKLLVEPERIGRGILKPSKSIEECQAHFIIFFFKERHDISPFASFPI